MKVFLSSAIIAILVIAIVVEGYRFESCEMARTLLDHGFPRHELADWVCLIEHESSFNTTVVGPPNSDGSRDYGLFQINSAYWCKGEVPSKNLCGVSCYDLLSDDISRSVKCAKLIYRNQGLSAWVGWVRHCQGRAPSVDHCFSSGIGGFGMQCNKW